MKNQKSDFSVLKEEIAQNNVLNMAELITIMEVRFQIGYIIAACFGIGTAIRLISAER